MRKRLCAGHLPARGVEQGELRDIHRDMMTLSLGIIGETVFRTDLGDEVHALNDAMSDIMEVYNAIVLLPGIRLLLQIPFTPLRKFVHARAKLHRAMERLMGEHRRRTDAGGTDLLTMILEAQKTQGWSDEYVRDQVMTMTLAGYETTAIALTWTWYLLSQTPTQNARWPRRLTACWRDVCRAMKIWRGCVIRRWSWRRRCGYILRRGRWAGLRFVSSSWASTGCPLERRFWPANTFCIGMRASFRIRYARSRAAYAGGESSTRARRVLPIRDRPQTVHWRSVCLDGWRAGAGNAGAALAAAAR